MSAPRRLPAWRDDDDHAARRAMVRRRAAIRQRDDARDKARYNVTFV